MSFSERVGIAKRREIIQLNSMDANLRVALYNLLHDAFMSSWYYNGKRARGHAAARRLWTDFWHRPVDKFSGSESDFIGWVKGAVLNGDWNAVYDLVEFVHGELRRELTTDRLNVVLQREMSGYRASEGMLVPISDSIELETVEEALAISEPFAGARTHLAGAVEKLAQKPEADVRNAITEAVSAVESAARVVAGKPKATLADALKALERAGDVHPALKDAWLKLYGYTSDEEGLRHAMTEDPHIDFATAKYMVVSCAAFVNLLSTLPPAQ